MRNMTLAPLSLLLLAQSLAVPVPLEKYEELTRRKEPRSLTVVEAARVSGSFAKGLVLTLTGRSMGDLPAVPVLDAAVVLDRCVSDQALLSRTADQVHLTPLGARFTVRCGLAPSEQHSLVLPVLGVVDVGGTVADGEVSTSVKDSQTVLRLSRREAAPAVAPVEETPLPPTVVGHYRVTVLPDDARFRWVLDVHNPNRKPVSFPLPVRANETLEKLETTARYEPTPDGFTVELPPGDTKVAVIGAMKGTRFEPPIDAAAQLVLIDSHPLLRLEVVTEGKRLSPAETGLDAEYRGAQGLLLARGQTVQWHATVLETLASSSYTVRSLHSTFFAGADGRLFGESRIALDNEGAAELTLPMRHKPDYATIADTSVPLTSTAGGDLRLPLARGAQDISVQHQGTLSTGFGLAFGRLELPGVGTTTTSSRVDLRTGSEWVPLYQGFASKRWLALPAAGDALLALCFAVWALTLFTRLGLSTLPAGGLALVTALLASSNAAVHWPVVTGLAGLTTLMLLARLKESKVKLVMPSSLVGTGIAFGVSVVLLVGFTTLFGDNVRRTFGMSADALAGDDSIAGYSGDQSLAKKTMKSFGTNNVYGGPPATYQGVAAARQLPAGRREVSLSEELVDTSAPTSASVVLVSSSVVNALYALLNLAALVLAFVLRGELLGGLKALLQRLFVARPAEQELPLPS